MTANTIRLDAKMRDGHLTGDGQEIQTGHTAGPGKDRVVLVLDPAAAQTLGRLIAAGVTQLREVGLDPHAWNHTTVDLLTSAAMCSTPADVVPIHRGVPVVLATREDA